MFLELYVEGYAFSARITAEGVCVFSEDNSPIPQGFCGYLPEQVSVFTGKIRHESRQEPQEQFSRYLWPAAAIRTSRGNSVTGIGPLLRGFGSLLAFFQPSPRVAGAETFLARRIGGFPPLTTDRAIVEPAQRPPEAPDGTFRVWVLDVGYRLFSHGAIPRDAAAPAGLSAWWERRSTPPEGVGA